MNSAVRKGMHAAGSGVGGQGLNAVPSTNTRRDGRQQDAVISDLKQQVEDLEDLKDQKPVRAPFLILVMSTETKFLMLKYAETESDFQTAGRSSLQMSQQRDTIKV
jgi:hypothetical protein